MFWIGFIVGMVVLALISFGIFAVCMKACGLSWKDYNNLVDANAAAIDNRDSRIEVYMDGIDEKVFEAKFKYPWGDNLDE